MSKDLAIRQSSALTQAFSEEQVEILRKTLFKKFSDDEIQFALAVCNRTGLDPFSKQVHFRKQGDKEDIVIITGIDGFRLTANRSQAYAGSDEPVFEKGEKYPIKATVTVYKIVQGVRCAFVGTARWDEYYPGDKQGFMWRKMPFTMLGKCAESQALRKAFPAELSGIYSHEEMAQSENSRTLVTTKADQVNSLLNAPSDIPDVEIESVREPEIVDPDFEEQESLGDYIIPIGQKHKGKKLSELTPDVLKSFVDWVDEKIERKNEQTVEFLENARRYLEESF